MGSLTSKGHSLSAITSSKDVYKRQVYIGAGKSGLSYRFYDKDKEVCSKHNKTLDEVGSWKRTEMQLRDDKAHAFAMTFKDLSLIHI